MIETTEAVVLQIHPFSQTSHVVVWLTPGHGRIACVVKGACRYRSPFLGQYDLFYTCELVFYNRESGSMHIAKECVPIATRSRLRSDWRAAAGASYLCAAVAAAALPAGDHGALYRHTSTALDCLNREGVSHMLLFWFEIRLMALLGFAPQLNRCSTCGGGLAESSLLVFSVGGGGIVCPSCAGSQSRAQSVPLSPDVLAILRQWQKADAPRVPLSTRCTAAQLHALRKVLGAFLEFHLNLPVVPRSAALRWIEADPLALADAERQQQQGGLDEESHSRTESGGSGRLSAV